uniref:Thymosin beta-4 n=1 Tax=Caenorhabditis tropicalis TaxID=1561998 RepID=A0A1I7T4N7_9PELO
MNKSEQKPGRTEEEKAKMLKKKTPEELAALASKKTLSAESIDEPAPLARRPSELSMDPLNNQLKKVPMVQAFNSAENHFCNKEEAEKKK